MAKAAIRADPFQLSDSLIQQNVKRSWRRPRTRPMSALGQKRTFSDTLSNVRYWGQSGHKTDPPPASRYAITSPRHTELIFSGNLRRGKQVRASRFDFLRGKVAWRGIVTLELSDPPSFEFGRQRRMERPRFYLESASRPALNVDHPMAAGRGREIARRGCHMVASRKLSNSYRC